MKRALRLPLLGLLAACGDAGSSNTWVDELPPRAAGRTPLDAGATWLDLLELEPVEDGGEVEVRLVELTPDAAVETAREEMVGAREGRSRVLSDQRRAWVTAPLDGSSDGPRSVRVEVRSDGVLRTAFALVPPPKDAPEELPPDEAVRFAVTFDPGDADGGGDGALARAVLRVEELDRWHDVRAKLPGAGWLTFTAESDSGLPVRAAFATPTVELERSRVPDVALVSVDTLRADRLGAYGYERPTSPNIDALAARGVLFERCISQAPWTMPSYGSLFTSLLPTEHRAGVSEKALIWEQGGEAKDYAKAGARLAESAPTIASVLKDAGYRTAGIYFNPYLSPAGGVGRGFDEWVRLRYAAQAGVDRALAWLDHTDGLPRFLFLHLIDPHWPYAPPAPFDVEFAGRSVDDVPRYPWDMTATRNRPPDEAGKQLLSDLYDGEIAYADDQLGRVFERLEASGALVVFQSDHGEELWEHGRFEHGHAMNDELLHVPLVIAFPGRLRPGQRVANQVRTIDVFPTILDLLDLDVPPGLRGSSLVPFLDSPDLGDVQLSAYAESILWGRPYAPFDEAKALVTDGYKIVAGDGAPPTVHPWRDESRTLADPELTDRLWDGLRDVYADAKSRAAESGEIELSAEERAALDALGYTDTE